MLTFVDSESRRPSAAGQVLTTTVVDQDREWRGLAREWNELLANSASDNPFLTWEWLDAWRTHVGRLDRLHVVTVRDGERLVAIAPLCSAATGFGPLSRTTFLGTGPAGSDYLDLIVRRGYEPDAVAEIGRASCRERVYLCV